MEGFPQSNWKSVNYESETSYRQDAIILNDEPLPIRGDLLKLIRHRSMGALTFLNKYKKLGAGTVTLISKDIVLTAAHNIFDREKNYQNTDFKLYFGADGKATTNKYQQVERWKYPQQFKNPGSISKVSFDFAIMKLKRPVNFDDQYMSLCVPCSECLLKNNENLVLQIFGFPCSYPPCPPYFGKSFNNNLQPFEPNGQAFKLIQYGRAIPSRIISISEVQHKIDYGISTLPGQSGCAVVIDNIIIAIHVGGDISNKFNIGRLLDKILIQNITKWIKQLSGTLFSLKQNNKCEHKGSKQMPSLIQNKSIPNIKEKYLNSTTISKVWMPKKIFLNEKLVIKSNNQNSLNLQSYSNLLELDLSDNLLLQIDLNPCPLLKKATIAYNKLHTIRLQKNTLLTQLSLSNNNLQKVIVSSNIHLEWLYIRNNKLKEVDVSNNLNLSQLDLHNNKLTKMDCYLNIKLRQLRLSNNKLASICVTIAKNVDEDSYINYFHFSNQQTAYCCVKLKCQQQESKNMKKRDIIRSAWRQGYADKKYSFITL